VAASTKQCSGITGGTGNLRTVQLAAVFGVLDLDALVDDAAITIHAECE